MNEENIIHKSTEQFRSSIQGPFVFFALFLHYIASLYALAAFQESAPAPVCLFVGLCAIAITPFRAVPFVFYQVRRAEMDSVAAVPSAVVEKKSNAAGREKFMDVYQQLKKEILSDSELVTYTEESRAWVEEMLDYTVPGGKLNRGLSVVHSLELLKKDTPLSELDTFNACALGWCIEWLQGYFLVMDDIMDNSVTRRGQPCWYRVPKVGLIAINDGIILRTHISRVLKTHFRQSPIYVELVDLFNDVACALLLAGETSVAKFEAAKEVLVQMGTYFQVQDDYLDCYGAPEVIGKIGTDIEDTKCSWLIVQALKRANESQKQLLKEKYGKKDPACVVEVKRVYNELELQKVFEDYERDSYVKLIADIEKLDDQALQVVLKSFLAKIYKREK